MNDFLQIIGSIASIGSIPLAIYLYLKSQAQKYFNVRRDIVERLSSQLGEGRRLSLFEVQAVNESKARENKIRANAILPTEIIQDLVTETINSRLLESSRKDEIIQGLQVLHSQAHLYSVISANPNIANEFTKFLKASYSLEEPEKVKDIITEAAEIKSKQVNIADAFGIIVGVLSIVAGALTVIDIQSSLKFIPKLFGNEWVTSMLLGMLASAIAGGIAALIKKLK